MNDTRLTQARELLTDATAKLTEIESELESGSTRGLVTATTVHIGDAIDLVKYLEER